MENQENKVTQQKAEKPQQAELVLAAGEKEAKIIVFQAQKQFEASNEFNMNFNREASFAIQILTANPYLSKLDPISIRNSVVNIALTGLTLNPALKYAYLVPRNGKCVLDISYMGLIKLLTDAGAVKSIDAAVIYQNDKCSFRKGSNPDLIHEPCLTNRGEKIGAYAIAYFRDCGFQFEILPKDDIEKIKRTSESWKNEKTRNYSPWENWEDEMWKKTALKRLFKLLPKTKFSESLIAALSVEHDNELDDLDKEPEDKYAKYFDEEAKIIDDKK